MGAKLALAKLQLCMLIWAMVYYVISSTITKLSCTGIYWWGPGSGFLLSHISLNILKGMIVWSYMYISLKRNWTCRHCIFIKLNVYIYIQICLFLQKGQDIIPHYLHKRGAYVHVYRHSRSWSRSQSSSPNQSDTWHFTWKKSQRTEFEDCCHSGLLNLSHTISIDSRWTIENWTDEESKYFSVS